MKTKLWIARDKHYIDENRWNNALDGNITPGLHLFECEPQLVADKNGETTYWDSSLNISTDGNNISIGYITLPWDSYPEITFENSPQEIEI